jgi:hypothetical protein
VKLVVAAVSALLLSGCGGGDAKLTTFAGTWQGHTRGLRITRAGLASELIYSGCCHVGLAMRFRLSEPRGTSRAATATATVTSVRIPDETVLSPVHPAPRVGQTKKIRLRDGVITETITGTKYCSPTAKHWVCGA